MRDGVRLHTRICTPKDSSTPYPILLTRTPYYGFHAGKEVECYFNYPGPGPTFPAEGHIFVIQDVREGPSADVRPPVFPGGNPGSVANYYEFFLELDPLANVNKQSFENRIPFWNDIMEHGTYDAFWRTRSLAQRLTGIDGIAVLVAGSWFDDQDLYGTLRTYRAIEDQNPGVDCSLVMGVWNHASWWAQKHERWGKAGLPARETADHYRDDVLAPFFRSHLKGVGDAALTEALVYASSNGGWRSYETWPPRDAVPTSLYLAPGGSLLPAPLADGGDACTVFTSDPADPVPHPPAHTIGGWSAATSCAGSSGTATRRRSRSRPAR